MPAAGDWPERGFNIPDHIRWKRHFILQFMVQFMLRFVLQKKHPTNRQLFLYHRQRELPVSEWPGRQDADKPYNVHF